MQKLTSWGLGRPVAAAADGLAAAARSATAMASLPTLDASSFESAAERLCSAAKERVGQAVDRLYERRYVAARDGFMAYDAGGKVFEGVAPSATEYATPRVSARLGWLANALGRRPEPATLAFVVNGIPFPGHAGRRTNERQVELAGDVGAHLLADLDPASPVVSLRVVPRDEADRVAPTTARVLALPRDYRGPIFICDIDQTLRDTRILPLLQGVVQPRIPGARRLLEGVASRGVPIVYLSAGGNVIRPQNEAFLKDFPPGILLDNLDFAVHRFDFTSNRLSAENQRDYKKAVIAQLKETYPEARFFGLGDNLFGDALAYHEMKVRPFIHDVKADHANLPASFDGLLTRHYDDAFMGAVWAELDEELDAAPEAAVTTSPRARARRSLPASGGSSPRSPGTAPSH